MDQDEILSIDEVEALLMALANGKEDKRFTEEEAEFVVSWAKKIRFDNAILDVALGKVGGVGGRVELEIRLNARTGVRDVAVGIQKIAKTLNKEPSIGEALEHIRLNPLLRPPKCSRCFHGFTIHATEESKTSSGVIYCVDFTRCLIPGCTCPQYSYAEGTHQQFGKESENEKEK